MDHEKDYSSGPRREPWSGGKRMGVMMGVVGTLVLGLNAGIAVAGVRAGGWGAVGMLFFVAPIGNGLLVLVSLISVLEVRRHCSGAMVVGYLFYCVLLPAAATVADWLIIASLAPGGC